MPSITIIPNDKLSNKKDVFSNKTILVEASVNTQTNTITSVTTLINNSYRGSKGRFTNFDGYVSFLAEKLGQGLKVID